MQPKPGRGWDLCFMNKTEMFTLNEIILSSLEEKTGVINNCFVLLNIFMFYFYYFLILIYTVSFFIYIFFILLITFLFYVLFLWGKKNSIL